MEWLTLAEFDMASAAFDAAVAAGPDVDRFCSASHWILPAHGTVSKAGDPWLLRCDEGWVALSLRDHGDHGRVLGTLETMWGFPCPFAGSDPETLVLQFALSLLQQRGAWDVLLLHGLPVGSGMVAALRSVLRGRLRLRLHPTTLRCVASLEGGLDGYLSRRSRKRRKALRRAERLAQQAGVRFELHRHGDPQELYGRIQAVETLSWKGQKGVGIEAGRMKAFYERMLPRLERSGRLRLLFGTIDGHDVSYCLAGVFGGTVRGLQQSYDPDHARLSLGGLGQLELLRAVCADGDAHRYDLGMDHGYKHQWAEQRVRTFSLYARQ